MKLKTICLITSLMILFLAFNISTGLAADWPYWRGPNKNNISEEIGWNPEALKKGTKILWKKNVGQGYSCFSIKNDLLYTMGYNKNKNTIYCLNAKTGKEVWKHTHACNKGDYIGPKSTPVIDGSYVYSLSQMGHLFCMDVKTGKIKWKKHIVDDFKTVMPRWNFSSSPNIHGDIIYINAGKHGMAINKKTGKPAWTSGSEKGNYSTPEIFKMNNILYSAVFGEKDLFCVNAKTGKALWSYPWETSWDVNASDPIYFNKRLFISSGYKTGCALFDISKGKPKLLWQNKNMSCHFQTPVIIDKYLYGVDGNAGNGKLKCLDIGTGKVKWSKNTDFGSLIAVNDHLIVINENGDLFIVKVSSKSYREISKASGLLKKLCWTPPVLCNGIIYIRNDQGDIAAVDVRK